jgi:hypothetical protein
MHDEGKIDDVVLALLHLNAFKDRYGWRVEGVRLGRA